MVALIPTRIPVGSIRPVSPPANPGAVKQLSGRLRVHAGTEICGAVFTTRGEDGTAE